VNSLTIINEMKFFLNSEHNGGQIAILKVIH